MTRRIHLGIVRTHFGHWASRSGYGLLCEYLQGLEGIDVLEFVTRAPGPGREKTPPDYRRHPIPWYASQDHQTECRVQAAVSEGRLDLVHFFDGEHGFFYSGRLSQDDRCRTVATYHQPEAVLRQRKLLGSGRHLADLDRVVVLSPSQSPMFSDILPEARIVCIPHGVDTEYYSPAPELTGAPRPFRCLSVGFWLRDLETLEAVASALVDREDVRFTLVGAGIGGEGDRNASLLGHLPNVEILEGISDAELLSQYRKADLLFIPLRDATANNVLLEGLACGLPVVTSDIPGARFYLPGEEACLCPSQDTRAFVQTLLSLKNNLERRRHMGAAARRLAESRYAWKSIAKQYRDLYLSIMSEKKRAPRKASPDVQKKAICTVISSDYLHLALALYYSLREGMPCDFYALVADNHCSPRLWEKTKEGLPEGFHLLSREAVTDSFFHLEDEDSLRWALKPSLMLFLLEKQRFDAVVFADSDICFFESIDFIFEDLSTYAVLLTPHWRPIDPAVNEVQFLCNMRHGLYNGGFVAASRWGIEALRWWERACRYRCEKRVSEGFYVDQKYLDVLPVYFDRVKVLEHKGCNVAEWNADHLPRTSLGGKVFVENWPVVFIHFTGLTIRDIDSGKDAVLAPYLEKYREYLARADRAIAAHRWHLLDEQTEGSLPVERVERDAFTTSDPAEAFTWCAVVNFLELPYFLLQWESLRETARKLPRILVGCADYESQCFLEALRIPDFETISWGALKSYRLFKQRARLEGDDRRFREIATPFFLKHWCARAEGTPVLYLANNIIFAANPATWFSELLDLRGNWMISSRLNPSGGGAPSTVFLWIGGETRCELIERWENAMIRGGAPAMGDALSRGDVRAYQGAHLVCKDRLSGASISAVTAVCYDDAGLLLHDWQDFSAGRDSDSQGSPLREHLGHLLAAVRRRYDLSRSVDLDPILRHVSNSPDLARIASMHSVYLRDFGERIREPWGQALSNTMNAYLLYLLGVQDRKGGMRERAIQLFSAVAETATLMPDLYRSKAHHHLGQLAEETGDSVAALYHYAECLKRTPHRVEAKQRMKALQEQSEILHAERMHG